MHRCTQSRRCWRTHKTSTWLTWDFEEPARWNWLTVKRSSRYNRWLYIEALRFASTSFNNDGVKFHLLSCIYIQGCDADLPVVLNTTISPPIFVDSRKTAKHQNVSLSTPQHKRSNRSANSLIHSHQMHSRRSSSKGKIKGNLIMISKSKTMLKDCSIIWQLQIFDIRYNPNFEMKVKHPLFLALKFSNCFKLYHNTAVM